MVFIKEREYHICIYNPESNTRSTQCPKLYYDSDEKKCVDSCENKKIIPITSDDDTFTYYECRNECKYSEESQEYEYDESIDIADSKNIFCLEKYPEKTPYFYKISSNQSTKCQKNGKDNHFYKMMKV